MKGTTPQPRRWQLLRTPILVAIGLGLVYLYVVQTPAQLGDDQILQRSFLESRLLRHIEMVVMSFLLAALIAVPVGVQLAQAGYGWRLPCSWSPTWGRRCRALPPWRWRSRCLNSA